MQPAMLSWHMRRLMTLWMQPTVVELAYETSDDTLNAANFCWTGIWDFWWYSKCSQPCWAGIWDFWWHSKCSQLLLSGLMRLLMILWMQPTMLGWHNYETSDDTLNTANCCWAGIWDLWWYSKCSQPWLSWHMRLLMTLWMQPTVVKLTYETSDDTLNAANHVNWHMRLLVLLQMQPIMLSWHMRLLMTL